MDQNVLVQFKDAGAVMVLGLTFGRDRGDDTDAKGATYARVARLMKAFEEEFGTVICRELIRCDLSTEEGRARFKAANLHFELCAKFVAFAARQARMLIED